MQRKLYPLTAISTLLFLLLAGCSGTPDPEINGEPTYVDDDTLVAFDRALWQLGTAIENADEAAERSARVQLTRQAQTYQRALLSALHDYDSTPRRYVAAVMLGFTGDAAVIPALLEKVRDTDEEQSVRLNSLLGLAAMDAQGDKLNDYPDHAQMMSAIAGVMDDPESGIRMKRAAIQAYAAAYDAVRKDRIDPIRKRVVIDSEIPVKIAAINALGDIGDVSAVGDLTQVGLNHPDPSVRVASAIALGKINDPTRVIPALTTASVDENALVRRHAIDAVARHHGSDLDRVYATVLGGLADFDERVRESAALALRTIGDERAVQPLLQATGDRTAVVREAAAHALGKLITTDREKEAYPLVYLLADQNLGVQVAARQSLEHVTTKRHGTDQTTWRKYFYTKYPELDPAKMYEGKAKPRFSSGISSSGNRARSTNTRNTSRTNPYNQGRRNPTPNTNNRNNNRNRNRR
jgi:HEAT repeat protein